MWWDCVIFIGFIFELEWCWLSPLILHLASSFFWCVCDNVLGLSNVYWIDIYVWMYLAESFKFCILFPFLFLAISSLSLPLQHVFLCVWALIYSTICMDIVFYFQIIENPCSFIYTFAFHLPLVFFFHIIFDPHSFNCYFFLPWQIF